MAGLSDKLEADVTQRENAVTLLDGHVENKGGNAKSSAVNDFFLQLKDDKLFQRKFIIFICLCYAFLVLGLNIGQFGPTLLDLQMITGCSLDQASYFFNAHTIGYLISSVLTGIMFERFNKLLQMFFPILILSGVVAAIPWCVIYEAMVTIHFFKGCCLGFLDAVGNAILLHIFAQTVKTYIQILHFTFAFGGILSPIISASFLSSRNQNNDLSFNKSEVKIHNENTTLPFAVNFTLQQSNVSFNISEVFSQNEYDRGNGDSEVYKAYTVIAFISLSSAIPFLVLYILNNESSCPTSQIQIEEEKKEAIPFRLRVSVLVILAFIIAFYTALEDTYAGFLMTFTVKHLKWTKAQGSFATSVFWTSFAVGRFSGIFIVNIFRQARLLRVYSLLIIAAFICLLVTSLNLIGEGVWVASVIAGFAMSIFFPIFFSWTEEKFFHVDGKMTALIMTCAMIGVIVNPIILGRKMKTAPIWFGYVLLVESGMLFLCFSIGEYIAKLIKCSKQKSHFERETMIRLETIDPLKIRESESSESQNETPPLSKQIPESDEKEETVVMDESQTDS